MRENLYTITKKDLFDLLARIAVSSRVVVPYINGEQLYFGDFDPAKESRIELGGIRQAEPIKTFLNHPREMVVNGKTSDSRPLVLVGVKACDLASLDIQDFVFLKGDPGDPLYSEKRKRTTIISVDCTYAKETCYCVAMDGAPYPSANFDINLSIMDNNILVEAAGSKANDIISAYRMFFKEATPHHIGIRDSNRNAISGEVKSFIDKRGTPLAAEIKGKLKENYNKTELWEDMASTCVECGACNLVCPTCHCFLLFDESKRPATRGRIWDSCLYKSFARVAGGANPRKHLYERLRNRFDKKFDFFPEVLGKLACTGCGRCIEACAGDIDIREVLKGVVTGKWNKPPHE